MATAVEERTRSLATTEAIKYLEIYNAPIDWEPHIKTLFSRKSKALSETEAKEETRKAIAFAIMLPQYDKSKITNPPENLLFSGFKYDQFNSRDWVGQLFEVMDRDEEIKQWRTQCLSIGIISPVAYSLAGRQALNWLCSHAKRAGDMTDANKQVLKEKFEKLVQAYGGMVISNIIQKDQWGIDKKILNWRTTYFFERHIFEVYTLDQVLKIKEQELRKTNTKLVHSIIY